ncbi:MAG: UDP-N-acetylglucosamine 2-epimerase (non-hydrolyzing) [Candidatus Doudnabacteria bacterium]|nr:UDP-N-acetylglucosamine 2-epimerase (non-hydrolyzing) [Candidatus Doudnabacteria bacterium]
MKVLTIFGTRPEIIKLSRVLARLDEYTEHIMVHTGQSFDYEMNQIFFDDLHIRKPDYFLGVQAETLGAQIANVLLKSEAVLKKEKPDAVLILGDTNSALSAIVAKRMGIPIFHMEAGNRAFDENVPEEINRRIVDHISDVNLVYSEHARLNLLREGLPPDRIFVTGSPMAEIYKHYGRQIGQSKILKELRVVAGNFFVVSIHREDVVESRKNLSNAVKLLNTVAKAYQLPLIVTTHPRTRKRLWDYHLKAHKLVKFREPFGFFDYVHLQKQAFCILSDSGTIPEEAAILGLRAVQLRSSTERPEAYDEGNLILSGFESGTVLKAIEIVTRQAAAGEIFDAPRNYRDANVSSKVLRHIVGLTTIVRKRR